MNKLLKNNTGSAIVTVLVLFVAFVGYTLYFIGSARLKAEIKRKSQNDVTVMAASASIRSILSTPANCNASFSGIATGVSGYLPAIKRCSGADNCYTGPNGGGTGTASVVIPVVSGTTWDPAATGIQPSNVRLIEIRYNRIQAQTIDRPAIVQFTFRWEKRQRDGTPPVTAIVETKLDQYVVYDIPTKTTITGCPRNPNTIDVFGDKACHLPWNFDEVILHNASIPTYRVTHAPNCETPANKQNRVCSNTVLGSPDTFVLQECTNDGDWSATSYSNCSCAGTRTASRSCSNPPPETGGLGCSGSSSWTESCIPPGPPTCP